MHPPVVDISELHLTLTSGAGPVHVLRGIDLQIEAGESIGLVGPSGSGKSTLMSTLAGLERPSSGSVKILGQEINHLSEDELAVFRRERISVVFQAFHLIPTMTALENVAVPLELAGSSDAFAQATAELEAVGLGQRLGHYPGQLSGGEQQRVALARALVSKPQLLLADEPTGNLDGETGHKIIELMFELHASRNTTLVLITHDIELAQRCQRLVQLQDGQIVTETDSPSQATVSAQR